MTDEKKTTGGGKVWESINATNLFDIVNQPDPPREGNTSAPTDPPKK